MNSVSSLMDFLGAPIVVGDPEGCVIYLNPAFERAFSKPAAQALGVPLAMLFEGGGREAVLGAVAEVCTRGETVHFKLKEGDAAYLGLASPIEADRDRVGVVILLTDEPAVDERLLAFQAEVSEPLEEVQQALDELLEQTGGRRSERHRGVLERGMGALERARKWNDELHRTLCGRGRSIGVESSLDPVRVVREVVGRLSAELDGSALTVRLLAPTRLRAARGDAAMLETALTRLIRHRVAEQQEGNLITLSARESGAGDEVVLVFSVVDRPRVSRVDRDGAESDGESESEPRAVRATVSALGGRIQTWRDQAVGRVTSIGLASAPSR
jgi:PAS domain-containing protein